MGSLSTCGVTLEELEAAGYEGDGMTVELNDVMVAVDGQYGADPRITAEATDPSISDSEMKAAIEEVAGFPVDLEVGRIVPFTGVASGF